MAIIVKRSIGVIATKAISAGLRQLSGCSVFGHIGVAPASGACGCHTLRALVHCPNVTPHRIVTFWCSISIWTLGLQVGQVTASGSTVHR